MYTYNEVSGRKRDFFCTCRSGSQLTASCGVCLIPEALPQPAAEAAFSVTAAGEALWSYIGRSGEQLYLTIKSAVTAVKRRVTAYFRAVQRIKFDCRRCLMARKCCLRL